MLKTSIVKAALHRRLIRKRKLILMLVTAVILCWAIPAAAQDSATSFDAGEPSALTENIPGPDAINELSLPSRQNSSPSLHYWNSTPVGDGAQLLTLFCVACNTFKGTARDVPLVSVLRDTLGDQTDENDRVTYIWLLTYARPRVEQRILSAIPFFYWRVGQGSGSVTARDTKPLMDLSAPERPMVAQFGKNVIQWTAFDPLTAPVRASTQSYRSNRLDEERLHITEAISYLRQAPASNDTSGLTQAQLETVIARLELRKALLGGLVSENEAAREGMRAGFERERVRSRNWELLRQWAERTGLIFDPLTLAGNQGHYVILWLPQRESIDPRNSLPNSIWKLMGIRDPWNDERLENWKGPVYDRAFNGNEPVKVVPLAVYSLDYPRQPLVLIDFRNKLGWRRREMMQRAVRELMTGVLGISHFTNWYVYVGYDFSHFVEARRGKALDEGSRLDCYSEFRMELELDSNIDAALKKDMEKAWLAVNPLEAAPKREIENAAVRYKLLESEADDNDRLLAQVEQEHRFELSSFGESEKAKLTKSVLHMATLGLYKGRAKNDDISALDRNRRLMYQLGFLDSLAQTGAPPEVSCEAKRIESSVSELSNLIPAVSSARVRSRAEATLERLKNLSEDTELHAELTTALASIKQTNPLRTTGRTEVAALPRSDSEASSSSNRELPK